MSFVRVLCTEAQDCSVGWSKKQKESFSNKNTEKRVVETQCVGERRKKKQKPRGLLGLFMRKVHPYADFF